MSDIKLFIEKIKASKTYIAITLITLLIFLSVFLRFISTKIGDIMMGLSMKEAMTPKVVLGDIKEADVLRSVESPGRIEAIYSVDLVARINGYLQKKLYNDGDYVKKGQPLFIIEQTEYSIALSDAEASLKSARAQAKKADADYKRAKELVEKDYISKSTFDDRLAQRDIAHANVSSALANLNNARRNFSYTKVTSPIDGKVGEIKITQGNYVTAQSGALAKVVSIDPIYAVFAIDSKQILDMKSSDYDDKNPIKVELTLANGEIYPIKGVLDFVNNEVSHTTGTLTLRATFDNPNKTLIPGDFIRARVYSNKTVREVVVPQKAVLQDDSGKYVYTVDENQKATMKRIEVSGQNENNWIVTKGLQKGDIIVIEGALKVRDGAKVKILTQAEYEEDIAKQNDKSNGEAKK